MDEFISDDSREICVNGPQPSNEVVHECLYGSIGGIDMVVVSLDKLDFMLPSSRHNLNYFACDIVHYIEHWFKSAFSQIFKISFVKVSMIPVSLVSLTGVASMVFMVQSKRINKDIIP
jgi:hypothetical protein